VSRTDQGFRSQNDANEWLRQHDPDGVAFEYPVIGELLKRMIGRARALNYSTNTDHRCLSHFLQRKRWTVRLRTGSTIGVRTNNRPPQRAHVCDAASFDCGSCCSGFDTNTLRRESKLAQGIVQKRSRGTFTCADCRKFPDQRASRQTQRQIFGRFVLNTFRQASISARPDEQTLAEHQPRDLQTPKLCRMSRAMLLTWRVIAP